MLKIFGILAWAGCLLTLAYQGVSWVIFKTWPSITLMDVLHSLLGIDLLTIITKFPVDIAAKAIYVGFTTELALFFWWLGVTLLIAQFVTRMVAGK